ncbi:hypothetical protein D3C79_607250 [compost metagenome]
MRGRCLCRWLVFSFCRSQSLAPPAALFYRGSLPVSPDFSCLPPRLHLGFTQPHFPLTYPFYLLPTDKWACLPQGGEGPKIGEQDDEILDQIRVGRGLDTGDELLGRQCAGGADAPWPG